MLGQATSRLTVRDLGVRLSVSETSLRQFATLLVAAAVTETLLLRLVTRVGVHLPKGDAVSDSMRVASAFGTLALNFASVLAIALLIVLLASVVLRTEALSARAAVAALSVALLWGLGATLATTSLAADALFGLTMTALVALVGLVLAGQAGRSLRERVAIALMVVAYTCYQYYSLSHLFYRAFGYTTVPPLTLPILRLGEAFVVASGGAVFWAWGAPRWRHAGFLGLSSSAAVVLVIAAGSGAPAATTSILALWTTGLSLFLPLPLYLLSLGLFLVTVAACLRSRDGFWAGAGLLLLLLAGYMPEATYDHLLLLLGIAFAGGVMTWAERGHRRPSAELSTRP